MAGSQHSSLTADVIVIGGGVIGCSIAFRLAQARLSVTVIDRGEPGAEASSAAAGMIAPQGEMVESNAFFELCQASRDLYPHFVSEIEELSGKTVGYHREGTLLVAIDEKERQELEHVYQAQSRLGLPIERFGAELIRNRIAGLSPEIRFGLFIPGDHWLDNERLIRALLKACQGLGVRFLAGSPVTKLNARNGRVESVEFGPIPIGAGSSSGGQLSTLFAGQFVLAAGCWSRDLTAPLGITLPMQPCRGQIIEFQCTADLPMTIRAGRHYVVPRPPGRVVAGTTAEYVGYEKAVTGEGLRSILEGVTRIAPVVKGYQFYRAWAGLRPDTADHMPILGYGELENLIFATGHFRNGILLAPATAKLISELLLTGSTSLPLESYSPKRFPKQSEE